MPPWTLPDIRSVALAILIYHGAIAALVWWAAERTTINRLEAAAECPGPELVARRVIDYRTMQVSCVYYWRKK